MLGCVRLADLPRFSREEGCPKIYMPIVLVVPTQRYLPNINIMAYKDWFILRFTYHVKISCYFRPPPPAHCTKFNFLHSSRERCAVHFNDECFNCKDNCTDYDTRIKSIIVTWIFAICSEEKKPRHEDIQVRCWSVGHFITALHAIRVNCV